MAGHPPVERLLAEAEERTNRYEWMAATELYRQAMRMIDTARTGPVLELMGNAFYKAAFQSQSRQEFKHVMQQAQTSYQEARAIYEKQGLEALAKRANTRGLFASFWLKDDPVDRRKIITRCISLAEETAEIFGRHGDKTGLAGAHRDTMTYVSQAYWLAREWSARNELFEKVFRLGEKSIAEFEVIGNSDGLLECLNITIAFLLRAKDVVGEPARYQELATRAEGLITRMREISGKIGTPYALSLTENAAGLKTYIVGGDYAKELDILEAAISTAEGTKDSFLIAHLAHLGIGCARDSGMHEEDVERRRELDERGIRLLPVATNNLEIISHGGLLAAVIANCADCYMDLARFVETEPEKKRMRLRSAIEIAREAYSNKSYSPLTGHALSKALYFLSISDIDLEEKTKLLAEALPIIEETVREADLLYRSSFYQGVERSYLALVKAELSKIEQDPRAKTELLQGAVTDMQQCVNQCSKWATTLFYANVLARYEEWFGDILLQLYRSSAESDIARRAIEAYEDTIAYLTQSKLVSPVAAVRWKIAQVYDTIGDHMQASHAFRRAAEDYRLGAQKIPSLATAFGELGFYMESWSLIEEARLHHGEEQYLMAAENYSKAASTLQRTRTWGHLSKHYTACSFLENGEALSSQEKQEASIQSFSEAVETFKASRDEIDDKLMSLESQEKQELITWRRVTDGRERLCRGRIELEEAKILDRKGEEEASSAKFISAAEIFKVLLAEAGSEQARRELETLVLLCEAWGKMKQAETRASAELYDEAASSFTRIEKIATRKRPRLMALANASICKALESGTLFRRTRNTQLYSEIKKQLETATDYYQQAGLKAPADWTRATGNLFDALVHLADAATEREPKKKTEFYHLAEKHLQLAAKLYDQAGFPSRKEEALKHLERARQEKEILLTPMEALAENPAAQAAAVAPVSLLRDQPLGLERFEVANVVGNLSLTQREIGVKSEITLELEIANVGKTAATLIKLENITSEGLELDRPKIPHRVEDNYIDLRGKRLEHMKTHEVKIPMRAVRKGAFELRPRILFVDETGDYRSYEFEPVALTVRELGMTGWLKGPK